MKAYENRSFHKNWIVFATIHWCRKNMIKNQINVCAGKETANIDAAEFETFGDFVRAFNESAVKSKNAINNLDRIEGEKHAFTMIESLRNSTDKEPCYLAISADGTTCKDNRAPLDKGANLMRTLSKIGFSSTRQKMIGITGNRKQFMNDVHDAPKLDINSEHLLNCIMSNTHEVRNKHCQATHATRQQCGGNIMSKGVDPETIECFCKNDNVKSIFDDPDLHDKAQFPVDLTPLGDPMEFISK